MAKYRINHKERIWFTVEQLKEKRFLFRKKLYWDEINIFLSVEGAEEYINRLIAENNFKPQVIKEIER